MTTVNTDVARSVLSCLCIGLSSAEADEPIEMHWGGGRLVWPKKLGTVKHT